MAYKPSAYAERLKDPRWQRRRLEILQRSDFSCEACEAKDKTLHVHHKLYRKGAMPWEYDNHELQALCEDCHQEEHCLRDEISAALAHMDHAALTTLLGYARALVIGFDSEAVLPIRDGEFASGVGAYYGIGYRGVIELMGKDQSIHVDDVVRRLGI